MKPVLVDSNVILDLLMRDAQWLDWSSQQLIECANESELIINPIIYAEISAGFNTIDELEEVMSSMFFKREALPYEAAFLAGKAFLKYRQSGGTKRSPLPDFYISLKRAKARLACFFTSGNAFLGGSRFGLMLLSCIRHIP